MLPQLIKSNIGEIRRMVVEVQAEVATLRSYQFNKMIEEELALLRADVDEFSAAFNRKADQLQCRIIMNPTLRQRRDRRHGK